MSDVPQSGDLLARLRAVNQTSAFNRWAGIEIVVAQPGEVALEVAWREEFGQYTGFMHAGMIGALIDTSCGFAAATIVGHVLASQYQVVMYAPAMGLHFRVVGKVAKAGKRQVFANAELFAGDTTLGLKLVAGGSVVLITST